MFSQMLAVSPHQDLDRIHVKVLGWTPAPQLPGSGGTAVLLQCGVIRLYWTVLGGGTPVLGVTCLQLVLGPAGALVQVAGQGH